MVNLRLKKQIIEAVDNQINANDPPCTKNTFLQLQKQGCSKKEAKEMIAAVLLEEMYYGLSYGKKFDEKKYEAQLNELVNDDFIFDDVEQSSADEKDEILQAKYKVYDALDEHNPTEAVTIFTDVWDKIIQYVKKEFYITDKRGNTIKPELIDIDDKTDFKYDFFNWLQDMEMEFNNARKFEERIHFCMDVIDLFAWQEDSPDNYKTAVGEALNNLRKFEECDNWFESWLKEEPDNPDCINIYIFCLIDRGDIEKAKKIAEQYIDSVEECTIDNEIMFIRAKSLYEAIGDYEKAKKYQDKMDEFQKEFYKNPLDEGSEYFEPLYFNQPVIKEKKIGRNDPCPCGSGKKYKKCCGKNNLL